MSKKDTHGILSLISFILFVAWAVATIIVAIAGSSLGSNVINAVETIGRICAFLAMGYFAYSYYAPRKKNTAIAVLFWIAVIVGILAIIFPLLGISI